MFSTLTPWISFFLSTSSMFYFLATVFNLYRIYSGLKEDYDLAAIVVKLPECTGRQASAIIGSKYDKCKLAKETLSEPPWLRAVMAWVEDNYICGHGFCSKIGVDFVQKLPYMLVAVFGILFTVWLLSGRSVNSLRNKEREDFYSLPYKKLKDY